MNTPHFCQSIRALGFRWGLPYLLSTPLDILLEVSRVYNEGLERNAVGGVFSQCPMSALCGFLTVMQGNSGLPTSYSALLAGFVPVVPTPLIRLVSDWVRRHIKQGMSWCRFRWVGTRRVVLRYVSSSPPFSTVRATFTAHGAAPLVVLHGHP